MGSYVNVNSLDLQISIMLYKSSLSETQQSLKNRLRNV